MRPRKVLTRNWGVFISTDPLSESAQKARPQSWNRFSYVENQPLDKDDLLGLGTCNFMIPGIGVLPPPNDRLGVVLPKPKIEKLAA